jgi:NitT/TauT family transport system substrate-binding protein
MRFPFHAVVMTAVALTCGSATAQDVTKIRFTLDWKIQGLHAWYYWAQDKGYFASEKLDVTIDQGEGSAATVTRVISGAYDAGFGDVNAIIQTAAQKPGTAPVMVFMIYSKAPFALLTKGTGPIQTVGDLKGRKVGAPAGGAAIKLLPALARKNNLDPATVDVMNVAPNLQEQMLLQDQVDVVAAFTATSYMNLVALKRDPDKDFRWIYYADGGLDLYSNGVMVSAALAKAKPEAVRGLVRAIAKAMREVVANPDAAVELLAAKEPLIDKSIEKRRLLYVLKTLIDTPEARALGVGDIDDARMVRAVATMVEAYELPRAPAVGEVFDRTFLPTKSERTLPVPGN